MGAKVTGQRGFSVIEVLIILVVVGILGFTGWYVYHAKQASDRSYSVASSSTVPTDKKKVATKTTTTSTPDPYVGWKTFCSGVTNACFKYDPSWTFAECTPIQINMQGHFQNCSDGGEDAQVIAPDKTAIISWWLSSSDTTKPNACTQGSPPSGATYSDITQVSKVNNLYFVNIKNSPNGTTYIGDPKYDYIGHLALTTGENGQPPTVGQPSSPCQSDTSFLSKDGKYGISFEFSYDVNTNPNLQASDQSYPPSQTILDSVKKTLLSFYYK